MKKVIIAFSLICVLFCSSVRADEYEGPRYNETRFDFGHVGIDFILYHDFIYYNRSSDTVRILDVIVTCDCTSARALDSIVAPGDSARIQVHFNTKSFFGEVSKAFKIKTDHPKFPEIEYFYLAVVGQWYNGVQPDPISLFFLPAHKKKRVLIPNPGYDMLTIDSMKVYTNNIIVKTLKRRAGKTESLELEIMPSPEQKSGTLLTNVTLYISRDDEEKPSILTIPVKIVRF